MRKMKLWKKMLMGDDRAQMVVTHADDNCVHGERDANVKTFANEPSIRCGTLLVPNAEQ